LVKIFDVEIGTHGVNSLSVVIGGGSKLNTDDANRLTSGIAFTPLCWREEKVLLEENLSSFRQFLEAVDDDTLWIVTSRFGYAAQQGVRKILRDMRFEYGNEFRQLGQGLELYVRGKRKVAVTQIDYRRESPESFLDAMRHYEDRAVVFFTILPWENSFLRALPAPYARIGDYGYRVRSDVDSTNRLSNERQQSPRTR
jgi:hypothetical protein